MHALAKKFMMEQKPLRIHWSDMLEEYREVIEALVDDELDQPIRRQALWLIRQNPDLQTYYLALLEQKRALRVWWSHEQLRSH